MLAAVISAAAATIGVVVGSVINFLFDKSRRSEERRWVSSETQLRLYAEFLSLASRWLMEINWSSRYAAPAGDRTEFDKARRSLEEMHRELLIPFGMIRMTSSPRMAELAQAILTLCTEHQHDYMEGALSEQALWDNHEEWVGLRTNFTEQAHSEFAAYLKR